MNKILLLPHAFKRIGWVLFIPTALLGALMFFDGFNGFPSFLLPDSFAPTRDFSRLWNNIVIIGVLLGVLFIGCSRERIEDELIARIRLNALLAALYVTAGISILSALVLYDLNYLTFMIFNLFLLPVLFLIFERVMLWKLGKEAAHEE